MSKNYYLHTLDGLPAAFYDDRVCFMSFYGPANPLATSLKQIRREQDSSKVIDRIDGRDGEFVYSYRRVRLPSAREA